MRHVVGQRWVCTYDAMQAHFHPEVGFELLGALNEVQRVAVESSFAELSEDGNISGCSAMSISIAPPSGRRERSFDASPGGTRCLHECFDH